MKDNCVKIVGISLFCVCDKNIFLYLCIMIAFCRIGRRKMVVIASTVEFLANIIMPFSYNVYMFIVLRFLDGAAGLAYYQGAFIIGMFFIYRC